MHRHGARARSIEHQGRLRVKILACTLLTLTSAANALEPIFSGCVDGVRKPPTRGQLEVIQAWFSVNGVSATDVVNSNVLVFQVQSCIANDVLNVYIQQLKLHAWYASTQPAHNLKTRKTKR